MGTRVVSVALGVALGLLLVCYTSAAPEVRCDFFKTTGGFLRARGGASGNLRCGQWPSFEAAKQECWTNRECDGMSWGRWGKGNGGCLKKNRDGGFKRSKRFSGFHKTTMGCCSGDHFEPGQCKPRQEALVSLHKPAKQSSTAFGGDAGKAVDGNVNTNFGSRSCTHTKSTKSPWWQVDLGKSFEITRIVIINRGDCCWKRLTGFNLYVGDKQPFTSNPTCVTNGKQGKGEAREWHCPLTGRYVSISLSGVGYLTLCEVQVFASVTDEGSAAPPFTSTPQPIPGGSGSPGPIGGSGGVVPRPHPGESGSPGSIGGSGSVEVPVPGGSGSPGSIGGSGSVEVPVPGGSGSPASIGGSGGVQVPRPYPGGSGSPASIGGSGSIEVPVPGGSGSPASIGGSGSIKVPVPGGSGSPGSIGGSGGVEVPVPYPGESGSPGSIGGSGSVEVPVPYPGESGSPGSIGGSGSVEVPVPYPGGSGSPSSIGGSGGVEVPVPYPGGSGSPSSIGGSGSVEVPVPYPGGSGSPGSIGGSGGVEVPVPYPGESGSPGSIGGSGSVEVPVPYPGGSGSPGSIGGSGGVEVPVPYPGESGSPGSIGGSGSVEVPVPYPGGSGSPGSIGGSGGVEVPVPYPGGSGSPGSIGGSGGGAAGMNETTTGPIQPVSEASPTLAPVTVPSPEPVPVTLPSPTYVPVTVPSPEPVPVTVPSPEPVPVALPSPEPEPVAVSPPVTQPVPHPAIGGTREDIVSFGKNVRQSTTAFGGVAQRGNDGNQNSVWGMNSCTHTSLMKNPWWEVDLGRTFKVTKVVVTNRGDCCWDRLKFMEISVGDKQPYTLNPSCVTGGQAGRGEAKSWKCDLTGRYVTVSLRATNYLTLCEVQVYGLVNTPPPADMLVSPGKNVIQSSTAFGGVAQRGIDGKINSQWTGGSCTHTTLMSHPFWQVDLGKILQITRVKITNRADCCWDRLSKMKISVGNKQPYTLNPACVVNGAQARGETKDWKCQMKGRYVTISLEKTDYLTLCEVQVFALRTQVQPPTPPPPGGPLVETLLSNKKHCRQSSVAFGGVCARGVDGSKNSVYGAGSCTHTSFMAKPWWEVDLGRSYKLTKVVITNRGDCCWDRLNGMRISVGDKQPYGRNPSCVTGGKQGKGETRSWKCTLRGRYVTVSLDTTNYLTLCEVQVYGLAKGTKPPPLPPTPGKLQLVSKGKPCRQISTAFGGVASRAVDGNKNVIWAGNSCTHTNFVAKPWWEVDLGKSFNVVKVVIINRGDCCWDRLKNFKISVGDKQPYGLNPACVVNGAQGMGESKAWKCPLKGRYVTISLQGTNYLTLCEVEVYANVAGPVPPPKDFLVSLRKTVRQSSTAYGGIAQRAVDGNANSMWAGKSCTHTGLAPKPVWWQVDLGKVFKLTRVKITNRGDCCWDRLRDFSISVGNTPAYAGSPRCVSSGRQGRGETKEWPCKLSGRYVTISIPRAEYLTLCEVQVFASGASTGPPPAPVREQLVSFKKPTKQSSVGWGGVPARAVDGNRNSVYGAGSCTHTTFMAKPWWQVDLLKSLHVTKVVITNRGDCCWDRLNWFKVQVGDNPNGGANRVCVQKGIQGRGETKSWNCPLKGRFVRITLPGTQYLTLCEVQVFANVQVGNDGLPQEPKMLASPDEVDSVGSSDEVDSVEDSDEGTSPDELESSVDTGSKELF
ncbi:hypothetical protein BSKO_12649 [Bryopsis sp. KO-2023]|nr:hypothetical protein BSKO_12649 [Bryopsis sp. KO-2023]